MSFQSVADPVSVSECRVEWLHTKQTLRQYTFDTMYTPQALHANRLCSLSFPTRSSRLAYGFHALFLHFYFDFKGKTQLQSCNSKAKVFSHVLCSELRTVNEKCRSDWQGYAPSAIWILANQTWERWHHHNNLIENMLTQLISNTLWLHNSSYHTISSTQ